MCSYQFFLKDLQGEIQKFDSNLIELESSINEALRYIEECEREIIVDDDKFSSETSESFQQMRNEVNPTILIVSTWSSLTNNGDLDSCVHGRRQKTFDRHLSKVDQR